MQKVAFIFVASDVKIWWDNALEKFVVVFPRSMLPTVHYAHKFHNHLRNAFVYIVIPLLAVRFFGKKISIYSLFAIICDSFYLQRMQFFFHSIIGRFVLVFALFGCLILYFSYTIYLIWSDVFSSGVIFQLIYAKKFNLRCFVSTVLSIFVWSVMVEKMGRILTFT